MYVADPRFTATYDRYQMRTMLMTSIKPILFVTTEFSGILDVVAMAEAVYGVNNQISSAKSCADAADHPRLRAVRVNDVRAEPAEQVP